MNGLLVRVGADLSEGGGRCNGPVNGRTGEFVYVAIPEGSAVRAGLEKPYTAVSPLLARFGVTLPSHLRGRNMHLDPDFSYLTYGDQGERAKQLRTHLRSADLIVFYAGLADTCATARLVYAVIGVLVVDRFILARDIPEAEHDINAHSRRILTTYADDLVLCGRAGVSGRLQRCLPIGEYRDRAYRVRRDLLEEWGGLSVRDGYLQRSARLPRFIDAPGFLRWFERQAPTLMQANN